MITVQKQCSCGAVLEYEGSRRGEREALDKWRQEHSGPGHQEVKYIPKP